MEKLKGIGRVAIWLLGHLVAFSIYTADRIISVFAPWQPMPKYLTWYSFIYEPLKLKIEPNIFYKSVARVFFAIIGVLSYWVSSIIFDDYPLLIALAFDLCVIGMIVSINNIKAGRKAKNALKSISVIVLFITLSSCGKKKDHLVDIYVPDVINSTEQVTIIGSDGIPVTFMTGFYENVKLTGKEFDFELKSVNTSGGNILNFKTSFSVYDANTDELLYEKYINPGTTETGTFNLK